jgi:hypothetical protein
MINDSIFTDEDLEYQLPSKKFILFAIARILWLCLILYRLYSSINKIITMDYESTFEFIGALVGLILVLLLLYFLLAYNLRQIKYELKSSVRGFSNTKYRIFSIVIFSLMSLSSVYTIISYFSMISFTLKWLQQFMLFILPLNIVLFDIWYYRKNKTKNSFVKEL